MSRRSREKNIEKYDRVESVGIFVRLKDGQSREYPLELWQVDFLTEILGFQVRIPNLDDYKMFEEQIVSAKMDVFHNAEKELPIESWTEYWDKKENSKPEQIYVTDKDGDKNLPEVHIDRNIGLQANRSTHRS